MSAYTHGHHDSVLRSHRVRNVANSAAYLEPELRPGHTLLDVGCGPGSITVDLASRVAVVVGIDSSDEAFPEARALAGPDANVTFEVADVHALPYAPETFDVVHAHQTLQHVADPVQALREMRRVARPGGVVAARDADYAAMSWFPRLPELDEWMALYQRCARANGGEPDAGRRLLSWARAAGCTDIRPSASLWCYATPEDRAWWGGMWQDRILQSAMARQAVSSGLASEADLRRISAGWKAWTDAPDGWFTIVHGEILATR